MFVEKEVTIADILNSEDFHDATLVAGSNGQNNTVSWVHVLETWDDANEWIDGGELILCSGVGVDDPKKLVPFFQQLVKKGIAGFCLQLGMYVNEVPQGMIDLANAYDCPLLVFHRLVRFIDLTRDTVKTIMEFVNNSYLKEKQILDQNSWMIHWLNGKISEERIYEQLKQPKSEVSKYHFFTTIVEYSKSDITYHWSDSAYLTISKSLRSLFDENQFRFYPLFADGLLTAVVLDFGKNDSWKKRFKAVIEMTNRDLRMQEGKPQLLITAGCRSKNIKDIPRSYCTAKETMNLCQRQHTPCSIYEDMNLYYLLGLIDDKEKGEQLKGFILDQIKPLLTFDVSHNSKLMLTLKKYYQCNFSKKQTAIELGITRQSLYYRLEQIHDLLGVDLLEPEKRLTLEVSFMFYDYLFNEV